MTAQIEAEIRKRLALVEDAIVSIPKVPLGLNSSSYYTRKITHAEKDYLKGYRDLLTDALTALTDPQCGSVDLVDIVITEILSRLSSESVHQFRNCGISHAAAYIEMLKND